MAAPKFWPVVNKEMMLIKIVSIFNSCSHFVQQSQNICLTLIEGINFNYGEHLSEIILNLDQW